MAGGRPTVYEESMCEVVIALGKEGKSVAQMASALGVSKQALCEWTHKHEEFGDAIRLAKTHSQCWWEDVGQNNLIGNKDAPFQGNVWSRSMSARFPDDWRENKGVELTGADGGAVKTESKLLVEFVKAPAE